MLIFFLFIINLCIINATGKTINVDKDGSADYDSIQEAVNEAELGDIIYVHNGVYLRSLLISKSLTIQGENKFKTILDGKSGPASIRIEAENVVFKNFNITNYDNGWNDGAVEVFSDSATIMDNHFYNNDGNSVLLESSNNHIVKNNNFSKKDGLYIYQSNNCEVKENSFYKNDECIQLIESERNIITNNIFNGNEGVECDSANNNDIYENYFDCGIFMSLDSGSNNNNIYHNNFKKRGYVYASDRGNNSWDNGVEGNYWDFYTGEDANNDGIGDSPQYIQDGNNMDRYPLMESYKLSSIPNNQQSPSEKNKGGGSPGFELIFLVLAIALVLFWKRKKYSPE